MKKREETKGEFFHEIRNSFELLARNRYELIFPVIFDVLFVFLFGAAIGYFGDTVVNSLYSLGASMIQAESPDSSAIFIRKAIGAVFLMAVSVYLFYVFFHGLSWRYSRQFAGRKEHVLGYLKRFTLVNISWFILFIIYFTASFAVDFYEKRSILSTAILDLFLAAIFYLAFTSYALMEKSALKAAKESFAFCINNISRHGLRMLFIFAVILIMDRLLFYISSMSWALMVILGIFIMMPLLTFARIYIHVIVRNILS